MNSSPGLPGSSSGAHSRQANGRQEALRYWGKDAAQLAGKGASISLILMASFVQESQ